jgi:hypothetical protein
VRPKRFLSLWFVWGKPFTGLASRLALSPNRPNELPLEPPHLKVPLGGPKMIPEPMVHLVQTMHLFFTNINTVSK